MLKALKSSMILKHVKGHQDKMGTLLDNEATLNIAAHNTATASLKLNNKTKLTLPETKVIVKIDNRTVTEHVTNFGDPITACDVINYLVSVSEVVFTVHKYFKEIYSFNNQLVDQIW
jgi:hypothetical protein